MQITDITNNRNINISCQIIRLLGFHFLLTIKFCYYFWLIHIVDTSAYANLFKLYEKKKLITASLIMHIQRNEFKCIQSLKLIEYR